jgi:prepilin-type N-terminal cleavage/methylation domain-containing protein
MKRQSGFTLIEILVSLAILGILSATAIPLYHTWQGRAYGSEAAIMLKQIIAAEINYFLEHDKFFPEDSTYMILHDGQPDPADAIEAIANNINISIKQGHFLEYYFTGYIDESGKEAFTLTIQSREKQFDIVKGMDTVIATLDSNGNAKFIYPSY